MTRPDPTAFVWRGDLRTGTTTTARLVAYPSRVGRLRLRIRLRRATVAAIRESRTRLHDLASWLRGGR